MGVLANTRSAGPVPGRWIMVPSSSSAPVPRSRRTRLIRRRRQAFIRLLATAGFTGTLALVPGLHFFVLAHLAADAGLAMYVVHLRRLQVPARRTAAVPARRTAAVPAPALVSDEGDRVISLDRRVGMDRHIALDRISLDRRVALDRQAVSG